MLEHELLRGIALSLEMGRNGVPVFGQTADPVKGPKWSICP